PPHPTAPAPHPALTSTQPTRLVPPVTPPPPACPSLTAVIVAAPGATPVTSPCSFTVATPAWLLDQVTARLLSTFPPASLSVAPSCTVCPTVTLAAPGTTATDATGAGMIVTSAESVWSAVVL